MHTIWLDCGDHRLRSFPVGERGLDVGSSPAADVVIHDPDVPPIAGRVEVREGRVEWRGASDRRAETWAHGSTRQMGRYHALKLDREEPSQTREPKTLSTAARGRATPASLALVVGRGDSARRLSLSRKAIRVGSSSVCDIVLIDPTVSAVHLVLSLTDEGVVVRDAGSRNGTWVAGMRVDRVVVSEGTRIRAGRTDLYVVEDAVGPRVSGDQGMVAASPGMLTAISELDRFATLGWPLLIAGESGVGKEALAERAHRKSGRSRGPYVVLNAACVPRELVESELFGHERGAFTGASATHVGAFEQADGGTLFLDEIGELSLDMQSRLLRVLETWDVRRVGGTTSKKVDVRVVCATHRDLRAMVEAGTFRLDLYYRLARLVVNVPPLRERPEDFDPLVAHFLALHASETGASRITTAARKKLRAHRFPGNVRELRNVLGVAAVLASSRDIDVCDIDEAMARISPRPRTASLASVASVEEALDAHGGNIAAAARALGVPRSTLRDRLRSSAPPAQAKVDEILGDASNAA